MGMASSFRRMQVSVVVGVEFGCDRSAVLMMMMIGKDDGKGGSAGGSAWGAADEALCAACLARQGPAFACSSEQVGFVMIVPGGHAAQEQQQSR